jgi:hypothetical protein
VDPFGLREALAAPPADSKDTQSHGQWGWSATVDGTLEFGDNVAPVSDSPHAGMLEGALAKVSMAADRAEQAANTRIGTERAHIVPSRVWKETYNYADQTAKLSAGPIGWVALAVQGAPMNVAAKPGDVSAALPIVASLIAPVGAATNAVKAPTLVRALTAADLGLAPNTALTALEGTVTNVGTTRIISVQNVRAPAGSLLPQLRNALPNIVAAARAQGVATLQIEASFANSGLEKFATSTTKALGGTYSSVGGRDLMTFVLSGAR